MTDLNEAALADSERNTHLLDWLEDGYTHCQHGSRDWCESYLRNAKSVIEAQDDRIAALSAEVERMTNQRDYYRGRDKAGEEIEQELRAQIAALTKRLDEAAKVIEGLADMEREYESEYSGRTYVCCRGCDAQLSEDEPHDDDCPFTALDAARSWQASRGEGE